MLNSARAFRAPRVLQALSGVSRAEFAQLEERFREVVGEQRAKRRDKRRPGAGRQHTLRTLRGKLFCILFYLKC